MAMRMMSACLIGGLAALVLGCGQGVPDEGASSVHEARLTTPELEAYSVEEAPSNAFVTRPRVYLKNNTNQPMQGFYYFYYVKTEEGKVPAFQVVDAPGIDVSFERVDGTDRSGGDYYRVKYDCTNCPLEPGAIHPNPNGITVEIRNANGSAWNKNDDPSYRAGAFALNTKMPVYHATHVAAGGAEPALGWPADEVPVDPGDTQGPLPPSLAYQIPAFAGSQYTESVPKTLELSAMAELALGGMTQTVDFESADPNLRRTLFFLTNWQMYPPLLQHEEGSDAGLGKFMGPLVLNRVVSGSSAYLDLQKRILDDYLRHYQDNLGNSGAASRLYEGLIFNYFRDPQRNPIWKTLVLQAAQNIVEGLIVPDGADFGYWPSDHDPNSFWSQDPWREQVLLMAYKQLGYAPALDAVRKHINWARFESGVFSDDGGFQNEHEHGNPHFHVNALYLQPFLEYALLVKDQELIEFVQRSYEWAKSDSPGSVATLGYFPEFVNEPENGETCPITDMILTAMQLSLAGVGDYWDDVDTYVRNHFAESQLSAAQAECLENQARAESLPWSVAHGAEATHRRASERSIGGFAGWPTFNEWKHRDERGIQQCCTGNGARTIYHVWVNVFSISGSTLRVNLALNRAAPQLDVYGFQPYEGKLEIKAKMSFSDVRVRIPGGYTSGIAVKVNGASRSFSFEAPGSRYIRIGAVSAQQRVSVTFPNPTTTEELVINDQPVTVQKRGATVVAFSPGGEACPLYADRAAFSDSATPMQTLTRFASTEPDLLKQVDTSWKLPAAFVASPGNNSGFVQDGDDTIFVDFTGQLLLDGDQALKSRWSATGDGKYALFKLNRKYTVKYVNLASPEDDEGERRVRHFEIQVAGDDQVFRSVLSASSSGLTTGLEGYALANGGASNVRYVKLIGHGNHHGADFDPLNEFTELEMWGTASDAAASLATSSLSASSSSGGNTPAKARDNNLGTRWSASGDGQWIQFELAPSGTTRSVTSLDVGVYQGNTRIQYFDVLTSFDGDSWTLLFKGQSSGNTTQLESHDVPNIAARFVRIVGHENSLNDENALTEVRIMGY